MSANAMPMHGMADALDSATRLNIVASILLLIPSDFAPAGGEGDHTVQALLATSRPHGSSACSNPRGSDGSGALAHAALLAAHVAAIAWHA